MRPSKPTKHWMCSKCGLPCETISGDSVAKEISSAWPKSACCNAWAEVRTTK